MALDELYQEILLDHYKHPRNKGRVENADLSVELKNPFCGDEILLTVRFEQDKISDMAFEGQGCVISQASASLMTEKIKGLGIDDAKQVIERFQRMLKREEDEHSDAVCSAACRHHASDEELDELNALQGVCEYPSRVKCAMLAWRSLMQALEQRKQTP
ncbi:MAG TPA: SUF system NifU family Fe-S cluster assembly protein [bacterium]|nr:SUF system NifU family Fe-S cluster assembly protein [bacterium]HPN36138.1 SUF system NifU family Fe-S cluster assembly protein [bacterium]